MSCLKIRVRWRRSTWLPSKSSVSRRWTMKTALLLLLSLVLGLLRFILFATFAFFRLVFWVVFGFGSGLCLMCFLFLLLFARHLQTPLWAFLGAGIGSLMVMTIYDVILLSLAPEGYFIDSW